MIISVDRLVGHLVSGSSMETKERFAFIVTTHLLSADGVDDRGIHMGHLFSEKHSPDNVFLPT
jgi:hypothetical protein